MIAASITPPTQIPIRYLLISYPLSVMWALSSFHGKFFQEQAMQKINHANETCSCQILMIMGDRDQFTALGALRKWIGDKETENTKVSIVPGGDHFWFGMEDMLVKIIDSWLQSWEISA